MAKLQNQKAKILYLERMIRETGENRVITLQEILEELAKYGIRAERKSIYDDFAALRSFGFDVRFRRGKNSGYYLAGQTVETEMPGEVWSFEKVDSSDEAEVRKQMKLLFTKEKEEDIKAYFGNLEECKDKGENMQTCCVTYASDPQFFGWLTAMGKDVKILKPKKLAQSYRDYLKVIVKAYK